MLVNHWDPLGGATCHRLKPKVYASLINLPLQLWTTDAVATILSGFGVPYRASKTSLRWEDLTSFDVVFFREEMEIGQFIYKVSMMINFVSEQEPIFDDSTMGSSDNRGNENDDGWDLWTNNEDHIPQTDERQHQQNDGDDILPMDHEISGEGDRSTPQNKQLTSRNDHAPPTQLQSPDLTGHGLATHLDPNHQLFLSTPNTPLGPFFIPRSRLSHYFKILLQTSNLPPRDLMTITTDSYLTLTLDSTPTKPHIDRIIKEVPESSAPALIPSSKVFENILSSLLVKPKTTVVMETQTIWTVSSTATATKRSASIRGKKIKMLGLQDKNLQSDDILFLNSLTLKEIRSLAQDCGFLFPEASEEVILRMKRWELGLSTSRTPVL